MAVHSGSFPATYSAVSQPIPRAGHTLSVRPPRRRTDSLYEARGEQGTHLNYRPAKDPETPRGWCGSLWPVPRDGISQPHPSLRESSFVTRRKQGD